MTDQLVIAVPPRIYGPILLGHRTSLFVPAFDSAGLGHAVPQAGQIIQIQLREDAETPETVHVYLTKVKPAVVNNWGGYEVTFKRVNTARRAKPWRKR